MNKNIVYTILLLFFLVLPLTSTSNLTVDGTTIILGGHLSYDNVTITNNGINQINGSIGYLNITATENINITSDGSINGVTYGNGTAGSGGSGGSGGSPGNAGGSGVWAGGTGGTGGVGGDEGCGTAGRPKPATGGSRASVTGSESGRYEVNESHSGSTGGGGGGGGAGNDNACSNPGGNAGGNGGNMDDLPSTCPEHFWQYQSGELDHAR